VNTLEFKLDPSKTLQVQAYEYLHHKIINGKIEPGRRLVEQQIVEETGISRSPIREAIKQLKSEGLVTSHARGGVRVFRPTSDDFKYLYECRLSLEPLAASLAAKRANHVQLEEFTLILQEMRSVLDTNNMTKMKDLSRSFHQLILQASRNPYLNNMMNQLHSLTLFYRNIVLKQSSRLEEGFHEHERICLDILNRDEVAAEKHMKEHIQRDYHYYLKLSEDMLIHEY